MLASTHAHAHTLMQKNEYSAIATRTVMVHSLPATILDAVLVHLLQLILNQLRYHVEIEALIGCSTLRFVQLLCDDQHLGDMARGSGSVGIAELVLEFVVDF